MFLLRIQIKNKIKTIFFGRGEGVDGGGEGC